MDEHPVIVNYPLYHKDNIALQIPGNVDMFMGLYREGANVQFVVDSESMISTAVGFSLSKRKDINVDMRILSGSFEGWQLLYSYLLNTGNVGVFLD